MKICVIGDFSENHDEGLKNIAHYLVESMSRNSDVLLLKVNVKNILSLATIRRIKEFLPDIVHYVPGPTNKSLLLLRLIKRYLGNNTKIVLSAPHPKFSDICFALLNFKPDFVFASSWELKERMDRLGIPSCLLPNGVDTNRFAPLSGADKMRLREKYNLKKDSFTILHVGHIIDNRNLEILTKLSGDNQVVIVASRYIGIDRKLARELHNAGCIIFQGFFPKIEEFYQLSDCYLFPVKKGDSILCPLSILEAMSCNLPVITTEFDGIITFFEEGDGLMFARKKEDFFDAVNKIKDGKIFISTREKVKQYSWNSITQKVLKVYMALLS